MTYLVLAYYYFVPLQSPEEEVERHLQFFQGKDVTGRIYLSTEGINGQMSASLEDAQLYMEWMRQDERFSEMEYKIQTSTEHVFPRLSIRVRPQLVALDVAVDLEQGGEKLSPAKWRKMLEEKDETTLLLDVRNAYEWAIGHFADAELPPLETFREFPAYVQELKKRHSPAKTKVMMYCTGGIRCELYSALMRQEGFQEVYQLEGGVINYGQKEGSAHWKGKLFVFDDRLAVPISEEEPEVISSCSHCHSPSDVYYNCANMDCNELFLCCPHCAMTYSGCCSFTCQKATRIRPFQSEEHPKPFRRWRTG